MRATIRNLSADLLILKLKRNEDRRLRAGHVWIFSNEVDNSAQPLTQLAAGSVVRVVNNRDQFIGYACVNPHALICARLLSRDEGEPVDHALFVRRLRGALALRQRLSKADYGRLVFGESDGLPGLVLDRYGDLLVGQIATLGMEVLRPQLEAAIAEVVAPQTLVWKNDTSARDLESLPRTLEVAKGVLPDSVEVLEQGLRFRAPLAAGQKTGWFYDQTDNRERLRRHVVKGARVLDVCSYVGAWALTALRQGAGSAMCVDSSQAALDAATANASANGLAVQTLRGDAFDALAALHEQGAQFDLVIVDPPAFIKRRKDLPQGEAAYRKLNLLAMRLLADDGMLVSCSCSWHLPQEALPAIIASAASHAGRTAQILEFGGQSADHPVHPALPETRYLKTVFCRVTR
ncbi:MAG: class I SAM-dependent rRNA methyltransferase [Pseudomonadota bacterium]